MNKPLDEEPLLYSNVPLFKIKYTPFTIDLLLRKDVRFNYKSVLFIDEASLIATSQDYKDKDINNQLGNFLIFFRHETRGGCGFISTQSKNDLHYQFDRKMAQSVFITKSLKIPFFRIVWCREMLLMDSNVVNEIETDYKESINNYWFLIPKSIFKKYDSYAYSILTDSYPAFTYEVHFKKKPTKKVRFEIPTLIQNNKEINNNNYIYHKEIKEREEQNNG